MSLKQNDVSREQAFEHLNEEIQNLVEVWGTEEVIYMIEAIKENLENKLEGGE